MKLNESIVENAALIWFRDMELGYTIGQGPYLAIPSLAPLRDAMLPKLLSGELSVHSSEALDA